VLPHDLKLDDERVKNLWALVFNGKFGAEEFKGKMLKILNFYKKKFKLLEKISRQKMYCL
jgi:hypothetical protein